MFEFTEGYEPLLRTVREVSEKIIKPRAREIEDSDEFPLDMASHFFKEGYLQVLIPEQLGGMGKDITSFCIIAEEIAKVSASMSLLVIVQSVGTLPILISGNDSQKSNLCSQIPRDRLIMAFCLTEPLAGSDVGSIQMTATKEGNQNFLNGKKSFVTNGGVAAQYIVFAKTSPPRGRRGISAFVVGKGLPGMTFSSKDDKIGMRGIPSSPDPAPVTNSACYSPITMDTASWLTAVFAYNQSTQKMAAVADSFREAESRSGENFSKMDKWFSALMTETSS